MKIYIKILLTLIIIIWIFNIFTENYKDNNSDYSITRMNLSLIGSEYETIAILINEYWLPVSYVKFMNKIEWSYRKVSEWDFDWEYMDKNCIYFSKFLKVCK